MWRDRVAFPSLRQHHNNHHQGDQVEVFFNGKWLPAQVKKIVHQDREYGVSYVDQRESALPVGKGMLSRVAQPSIHRFCPDKMRPRLVNWMQWQDE